MKVAPFAGAWIEIELSVEVFTTLLVAPFAGAWIEICCEGVHPTSGSCVAPFAGAWIEIVSITTVFAK